MGPKKSRVDPDLSEGLLRSLNKSLHPNDRPWATTRDGCRLVLPRSADHFRRILRAAGFELTSGWDHVMVSLWQPGFIPPANQSGVHVVAVPAHLWTRELSDSLVAACNVKVHRLVRKSMPGRVESSLSALQKGLFTGNAQTLLERMPIHYVEWAAVVMCNGTHERCFGFKDVVRCHGTLVLSEHAEFPQQEVECHTDTGTQALICIAGPPPSVPAFVRRGRALGNVCYPKGSPAAKDLAVCLVTSLMDLRLELCSSVPWDIEHAIEWDVTNMERDDDISVSCGFFENIRTCPADAELSFQEVLDWAGTYQVTRHGIKAGSVMSHESLQAEFDSMLVNRHLASNDSDTEEWKSIGAFVWQAAVSIFPTTAKHKWKYVWDHLCWMRWALPWRFRLLPVIVTILCGICIAFAATGVTFHVPTQTAMWWSAIGLVGLTAATYSVGNLILIIFYATTAARLALDYTSLDEVLHARSVKAASWLGLFGMMRVHNTGIASAVLTASILALGIVSTSIFRVEEIPEGGLKLSAAPTAFVLGIGYLSALILSLWLASSIRLLCMSTAGARRALYILEDDLAFVNAIASSPLEEILQGMCDATPAELRAALGPRHVQYGSSKVIMPTESMAILTAEVERIDKGDCVDILATRPVGHLVLDLEYRVGRAEHGIFAGI
ncbi:hypothetical protein HDU85_006024 [Gaertneriomyces sp. JEL0708]|nr:hypothetical protein HDU85_006024 [Gaertneriomyces sp. JEL0708]